MAKVIIEVKILNNNDLIGRVVVSNAGRDKSHLYVIIEAGNDDYVFVCNGNNKTIKVPKKKKLKHLTLLDRVTTEMKESLISKDNGTDLKIKRFLKLRGIVKEG